MKHKGHGVHCDDGGCLILQLIAERDMATHERDEALAGIEAVVAIHCRRPGVCQKQDWCQEDEQDWPCATAKALGVSK